jgi:hypothetical protein
MIKASIWPSYLSFCSMRWMKKENNVTHNSQLTEKFSEACLTPAHQIIIHEERI